MIEINLSGQKVASSGSLGEVFQNLGIDSQKLEGLPLARIILSIVIVFAVETLMTQYEEGEVAKLQDEIAQFREEQAKLKKEARKSAGYTDKKAKMEKDREVIDKKIAIIAKLRKDRGKIYKVLEVFSQEIPKEVWIKTLTISSNLSFDLQAEASSRESVYQFVDNLAGGSTFQNIVPNNIAGARVVTFNLKGDKKLGL